MNRGIIGAVLALIIIAIVGGGSWYTVDQTERGVILRNGEARASNIKVTGEAEAAAIRARVDALGSNPSIISLTQAERWNGVLPTTMVPGSSVRFENINK